MGMQAVAEAMTRLERLLRRRPESGLSDDAPACATWAGPQNALRVVCRHPNGREVMTDMQTQLGGSGDQVSPGWLYRAGLASCAATSITMLAAAEGVALTGLEVDACSRSDARGLVGLADAHGRVVSPAPVTQRLVVRLAAEDATPAELEALVRRALQRSPIPSVVSAGRLDVRVEAS